MYCPWDNWFSGNLGFCEEILCSWVKQPGNTWSNLGFLWIGWWIHQQAKRDGCRVLSLFAIASIMTGLGSGFYHASGTAMGGMGDYLGMFLEAGAMTALNLRRWKGISWDWVYGVFIITAILLLCAGWLFPGSQRWIYALGSPCYLIEIRLYFLNRKNTQYRYFLLAWFVMLVAMVFWWLDLTGQLCNPENHLISGHALWHLLSAASLGLIYFYYRQFPSLKSS